MRIYVERILDIAHAEGLRTGENPARWKGNLELSLPKPGTITKVQHMRALPYAEMPTVRVSLKALDTPGSRALQFIILTASRMKWQSPPWRMSALTPHVPFMPAANCWRSGES
ncbi:MAG: hypothetical protein RIC38_10200 [Chromatocurvus sp.]